MPITSLGLFYVKEIIKYMYSNDFLRIYVLYMLCYFHSLSDCSILVSVMVDLELILETLGTLCTKLDYILDKTAVHRGASCMHTFRNLFKGRSDLDLPLYLNECFCEVRGNQRTCRERREDMQSSTQTVT